MQRYRNKPLNSLWTTVRALNMLCCCYGASSQMDNVDCRCLATQNQVQAWGVKYWIRRLWSCSHPYSRLLSAASCVSSYDVHRKDDFWLIWIGLSLLLMERAAARYKVTGPFSKHCLSVNVNWVSVLSESHNRNDFLLSRWNASRACRHFQDWQLCKRNQASMPCLPVCMQIGKHALMLWETVNHEVWHEDANDSGHLRTLTDILL